jgi:hypothetical protein
VVNDIETEIGEGVGKALHVPTVVIDSEVTLNEALEGGIDVEGAGFMVTEEVVFEGQPGVASHMAASLGDIL